MLKRISKFILIFIIAFCILSCNNFSHAASLDEMRHEVETFIQKGEQESSDIEVPVDPIVDIGRILTTIGVAVMLGVVSYMGIKYLTSGPEARAKLKQQLIGVLVAGLVIFGAYYIWSFVIDVGSKL